VRYGGIVLKRWVVRAPVGTMRYWLTLVAVVSRCGAGRRMQVKMFFLGLVVPLRDKLFGPRETRLRLRYGGLEVPWTVGPKSDFDVLNEVLVLKVYGAALPSKEPKTILDLGSHMGATVLFWRERFPRARIVAVEPDPLAFSRLRCNVGGWSGVQLQNVAACMQDRPVAFFSASQNWISSLSGDGDPVTVARRSFAKLVMEIGHVDLLKVDIEGAERYILDEGALQNVDAIVGEFHEAGDVEERERFFASLRKHFVLKVGQTAPFIAFSGARSPPGGC
jgi:FkbM family methyltransferase